MTTVNPTVVEGQNVKVYTWTGLANGDSGAAIEVFDYADLTVEVGGTLGTGGTCLWEGSNGGTAYATLHDPGGNALSLTAAGLRQVLEIARYQRPRVSAGDGSTSISVVAYCRRAR